MLLVWNTFMAIPALLKWALGIFIDVYFTALFFYLLIMLIITCVIHLSKNKSQLQYYSKYTFLYFGIIFGVTLLAPVYLLHPVDVKNISITSPIMRNICHVLGITLEVRGVKNAAYNKGAIVCTNHQSAVDIFSLISIWEFFDRMRPMVKREFLYVFPFGTTCCLWDPIFIDRKSKASAHESFEKISNILTKLNEKVLIFPEGTRNRDPLDFLPFKKGAFISAVSNQVPIIPLVTSRYYFIDDKKKTFLPGHLVYSFMDPIPTTGLTMGADVDALTEKTQNIMLAEYKKLEKESQENARKWLAECKPVLTVVDAELKEE